MAGIYDGIPLAPADLADAPPLTAPPPAAPKPPPGMYDGLELAPTQPLPQAQQPPRDAKGFLENVQAGWQSSAPGLMWRRRLPDLIMNPDTASWWERAAAGFTGMAAEIPLMVPGAMAGGPAGAALGTALTGPGAPIGAVAGGIMGAGAGMLIVPAGIRESLMQAYKEGGIQTAEDWWNAAREVATAIVKEGAIGAATFSAGSLAARGVGRAIAPSVGKTVTAGTATKAITTAEIAAQVAALGSMPAALEGRLPQAREVLDAAILVGGMNAAGAIAGRMMNTYRRTGKTPAEQVADAQADPRVLADLLEPERPPVDPVTGTTSGVPVKLDRIIAEAEFLARGGVPEAPNIRQIIKEIKDAGPQQGDMIADIERIGALHDAARQKPLTDPERAELEALRARVGAESDAIRRRIEAGESPEAPVAPRFAPDQLTEAQERARARVDELAAKVEALTDAERAERVMLTNAAPEALARHFGLQPLGRRRVTAEEAAASAQRVHDEIVAQLRDADAARVAAGKAPLGDDHAMAVAAIVKARVRTRAARLGMLPEEIYNERALQIVAEGEAPRAAAVADEAPAAALVDTPVDVPADAATFKPPEVDLFGNPIEVQTTPRYAVENMATVEVPLAGLVLSKEVPQFKHAADEAGVVVPLGGRFDRTGVGPIQVWERLNGTMEVISGRHRLDLARRSGEETIPAQVHREADGFDARQAAILDAQLNIREEQGSVADYVQYFKDSGISREAADERGLLARAKGRTAFAIARDATTDLAAAHRAGVLSDEAALSISTTAPGSDRLQALGMAMVQEGKSILVATNTMRAVDLMAAERMAAGTQGDIFGFDDSAMREASQMAKRASSIQRKIGEQISAVSGASRRPELARKMGVDVADPQGIQKRIVELKQEQTLWDNWPMHPELVAKLRAPEVTGRENELLQEAIKTTHPDVWADAPRTEAEYVLDTEIYNLESNPYVNDAGLVTANSRATPNPNTFPPVGTWRISELKGIHGREIEQLVALPIDKLVLGELDSKGRLDPVKAGDDARYAEWLAEGKRPPPINVVQTDGGRLNVTDGHRRALAAKLAGATTVEAWVNYAVPIPDGGRYNSDPTKPFIRTGMTYEMLTGEVPNPFMDRMPLYQDALKPETPAEAAARDAEATAQAMRRLEREAAQARAAAAQRPVLVRDEADGAPRLAHGPTALVEPKEWAREGDTVMYEHTVLADGREVGALSLGWTGDQVTQLHNIRTFAKDREAGHGTAMLAAILTHNAPETTVLLRHVIPSAREWWARRGAKFFETEDGEDGTITRADFEASPAVQAANRRAAGAPGEAPAPRIGVAGGGQGSRAAEGARQPAVGRELFQSPRPSAEFERVLRQHGEDAMSGRNSRVSVETAERLAKAGSPDAGPAALAAYVTDDFSRLVGPTSKGSAAAKALADYVAQLPVTTTGRLYRVMGFPTAEAREAFMRKIAAGEKTGLEQSRGVTSWTTDNPADKNAMQHIGRDQASIQGDHIVVLAIVPRTGDSVAVGHDASYMYGGTSKGLDVLVPAGTAFTVKGKVKVGDEEWVALNPAPARQGRTLFQDEAPGPIWYSALARATAAAPMASAPAKGWRDFLKGQTAKGGVKADEIKWSGLDEYLDLREAEGGKITRQEVATFLEQNGVKVTETTIDLPGQKDSVPEFRPISDMQSQAFQGAESFDDGSKPLTAPVRMLIDGRPETMTAVVSRDGVHLVSEDGSIEAMFPGAPLSIQHYAKWEAGAEQAQHLLERAWKNPDARFWLDAEVIIGDATEIRPAAGGTSKQAAFDITPAMRDKALAGMPLFQQHRGSFQVAENLITIMAGADKSTVVHELSHSWLEEMKADASRPDAPAQLKADWEILRRELAIPESGEIPRAAHEQFARSGERYLAEGDAPTAELRSVFARFREWLIEIYRDLRNLNVEINPDLRAVLDRMLATDEEIAAARELGVPRPYVEVAKAEQARQIVPGFKAEQVSMEPYADALPPGPGEAPNNTHVNYAYMNSALDVKLTMQRMAEIDQANIQKERGGEGGVKTWEQANAEQMAYAAELLDGTPDQVAAGLNRLLGPPPEGRVDRRLGLLKKVVQGAAEDSARLRDIVLEAGHDATIRQQLEYMGSIERTRMIQAEFLAERASVARALNALKDVTEGSGEIGRMLDAIGYGEAASRELFQAARSAADEQAILKAKLDEILLNYKGRTVLDIAKLHKQIGTLKGTYKFSKEVTRASTWEMVVEGWKAGLLSGPVTHTTNLFGTGAFMAMRAPVDALAAVIGMARGASPGMGESSRASMSEAVARLTGMLGSVGEALRIGKATFDLDDPTGKTEAYRTAIPGRAGELARIPLRLMGAEDAVVSTMYKRGELATLAIRQAFDEGLNPSTREFAERVSQLKDNPTPEMQAAADAAATRMTFNMPLGEKGVYLQLFVNKWNLQWMLPFIRTPINIMKEVGRHSPFAPLVGEWRADMARGGVARDRAIAEATLGAGIMALTMAYVFAGDISGGGSAEPGKNRGKAGVWQPYSWKIGDTWYEYTRIEPLGTLMGMAADIATAWDHMNDEEKDKLPRLLARAFANAVTNKTFLQGITNVVNAMSEPDRFAPRFLQQLAGSVVPNIIGQPTAMADPVVREVNGMLEAIQARIPGMRDDLLPKRDWLGQEMPSRERVAVVAPVRKLKVTDDKVRLEAARLDISMSVAPKKTHVGKGTGKLGDVDLTPAERDVFQKVGGEMIHKVLTNIVNAPGYDDIPDLVKRKIFEKVITASKRVAAVAALPPAKRAEYIQSISERMAVELAMPE